MAGEVRRYPVHLEEAQTLYPDVRVRNALADAVLGFYDRGIVGLVEASTAYRLGEPAVYEALAMYRDLEMGENSAVSVYSL